MARAHCECHADLFGWQVTCFAGSTMAGGNNGQAPRQPTMPNQLHPAFRPRQQQQQAASRRQRRSPVRLHDAGGDSAQEPEASPHEGFGEEISASSSASSSVSQLQQQQQATTTSKPTTPFQRQRGAIAQQTRQQQAGQANYIAHFSTSSSSEDDATLAGKQDNNNNNNNFRNRTTSSSSANSQNQQHDRLMPAASNIHNQLLTFQTIPILFSVKYLRNNMIEIDCDQSVPNYKAAMFRGFNVNEISSFTFNNCQLPSIPFAVLLHRTRTTTSSGGLESQQVAAGQAPPASGPGLQSHQSLKPTSRRQQFIASGASGGGNSLLRKRRQLSNTNDQDELVHLDNQNEPKIQWQPAAPTSRPSSSPAAHEPKVKSLIISLNAIVDQRQLITLLTGLDLLEELQLNYMQLNLSAFINDMHSTPLPTTITSTSTMAPSTAAATTATNGRLNLASPPASSSTSSSATGVTDELSPAASATIENPARNSPSRPLAAATSNTTPTSTSTSTTSTTTTTTTTTTSTTTTTTTTTTPPPTTSTLNLKPAKRQPLLASGNPTTTTTTTTTMQGRGSASPPSSTVATTATTRPSISMGTPRGLVIAQATGMPPTSLSGSITTTPISIASSSASQVPSVSLTSVVSSVGSSSQDQHQTTASAMRAQQQQPAATTMTNTQQVGPGPGSGQRQPPNGSNSNLISIGVSQSQSVSYTANGGGVNSQRQQPQQMFHLASPATSSQLQQHQQQSQQPPISSNLMSSSSPPSITTTQQQQQQQQLNPNRLHNSPSAWFAGTSPGASSAQQVLAATSTSQQVAAGSRLSMANVSGSLGQPDLSPSSSGQLTWSAISTTPTSSTAAGNGLSAPANTPPFTTMSQPATTSPSGGNFGFRNGGGSSPSSSSSSPFRTMTIQQQQQTRPKLQMTTTQGGDMSTGGIVAAGSRLHQNHNQNNQRRLQSTGTLPATTTMSRFGPLAGGSFLAPPSSDSESNQDNRRVVVPFGSSSTVSDEDDELGSLDSSTTPNLERIPRAGRNKRAALEEFELSFGELLPNLRHLKLESFIDMSPLVSGANQQQQQQQNNRPNQPNRKRTSGASTNGGSGVGLIRFKRQFQPDDMPEKTGDGALGNELSGVETLLAEESRVQPNPVMAPRQPQEAARGSNKHGRDSDSELAASGPGHDELDVEPGETLWRSASNNNNNNNNNRRSSLRPGSDETSNDSDSDDEGPPHLSVPAPPSTQASSSRASTLQQPDPSTVSPTTEPEELLAQGGAESPLQARQRQFSAFVLGKLFSRLTKLKALHLTSNEIPYWPEKVLSDSRGSLVRLYLISNNIRQLSGQAFLGLQELRILDLSSNQLRQLQPELLRGLTSLRQVRACRNLFRRLPLELVMSKRDGTLSKLESVDFSKNKYLAQFYLDQPLAEAMASLRSAPPAPITSLNLSDCSLGDQLLSLSASGSSGALDSAHQNQSSSAAANLNVLLFAWLSDLTSISLQNNKFSSLLGTANLFAKNKQLQRVDLSHNQLKLINGHLFNANASQIQELRLSHNKLDELPEQLLFNLRRLRHFSTAHNRLTQLPSKLFLTNQLLESIDLSHNQLTSLNTHNSAQIPFGHGANLRHLNLAHNNLANFEADLFDIAWSFYAQLQSVDLSHNKFRGQIQMPIFYTITDEMALNLASNSIQSVNVEALVQHEQVLDRFATSFETLATGSAGGRPDDQEPAQTSRMVPNKRSAEQSNAAAKVPTVSIRLANNPLACDCLLEPLVSYTRRVAAASNPALVASLFNQQQQQQSGPGGPSGHNAGTGLPPSSKYSLANNQQEQQPRQPQVLYQFKFNDLHCDKPKSLHRRLLSHVSIGDLLCPIKDERVCPRACDCHYQSAFKTAIVDCSGRQLAQVPHQLTDAANFQQFEVETSLNLSSPSHEQQTYKLTIAQVDKMIIRLDNNRLTSIEELSHLFRVVAVPGSLASSSANADAAEPEPSRMRFARAASSQDSSSSSSLATNSTRKKISPVAMARLQLHEQQRQTRQATAVPSLPVIASTETPNSSSSSSGAADAEAEAAREPAANYLEASNSENNYLGADVESSAGASASENQNELANTSNLSVSTAVLESAEEFRTGKYSQNTCELYLDHNSIESLPDSFLAALDRVRASALQASLTPPQAALPSAMLEPPIHTKLGTGHSHNSPSSMMLSNGDQMRASASSLHMSDEAPVSSSLFGRQPLAAEKKAALMETVQQNVRLSRLQQQQQQQQDTNQNSDQKQVKVTVSPSLVVLSLRFNNLGNIRATMLNRLSKLIKSSGSKLFFGHNPFNCSDNYYAPESGLNGTSPSANNNSQPQSDDLLPASPMGDQLLAASDSASGAYLEATPDDLQPSASDNELSTNLLGGGGGGGEKSIPSTQHGQAGPASSLAGQLTPSDCPVGQLKTWLTRHHAHVGDLDELYCVHMPLELAERLKLSSGTSNSSHLVEQDSPASSWSRLRARQAPPPNGMRRDHDHPWTSSLTSPSLLGSGSGAAGAADFKLVNTSQVHKNGLTWNAELLMDSAKLIDVDLYDLCPYSGNQLLDSASLGYLSASHQQALISVAIVFILLSLCLLLMLIYFGDTQTILAFVYIHLNPIYNCLHLNESHLDGEKLYDAFVSYSSADRDIVMELIEHLEQPALGQFDGQKLLASGKGTNLDRSRDALVTEADLRPDLLPMAERNSSSSGMNISQDGLGTLQRRSTSTLSNSQASSFQELSTMSRSTSRNNMLEHGGDYSTNANGSQLDMMQHQERHNNNNNNNNHAVTQSKHQHANSQRPYRLCIHERDWLPGHLISWNIVNSVQNSRRTILILSKEFIKSVWFQVEFHTAYYQMLEDKIDRLIVIVRGELPPKHELDKNLAFLLTTKTYLTWGEKWFWERLHYALPHRAGPPPPLTNGKVARAKQQAGPTKRRCHQKSQGAPNKPTGNGLGTPMNSKFNGSAAGLLSSLASGHADPPPRNQQQPLVMSSIGKDCSNLLLTNGGANRNNGTCNLIGGSSSSSSSGSSSNSNSNSNSNNGLTGHGGTGQQQATRSTSASSFMTDSSDHQLMATTGNDLLSSPISARGDSRGKTTRLSIGAGITTGMRSSSPLASQDSSRIAAERLSSSQLSIGQSQQPVPTSTTSGGITSIMLDGGAGSQTNGGATSRLRAKKQERLQSFVEKEISNHLNLSEL